MVARSSTMMWPVEGRAVDHDDVVAEHAVVGHVADGHDEAVAADHRVATLVGGAMDGDVLADAPCRRRCGHPAGVPARNFRSCGTPPMIAPWPMRQRAPMTTRPSRTT